MSDNETWQAPSAPPPPTGSTPPPAPGFAPPAAGYGQPPATAHGWTPPPRPGLIALRPMTLGPILGASFRVMRRNPRATLGPALVLSALLAVVSAVGLTAYVGAIGRIAYSASSADADALLAGSIVVLILAGVLGGAALAIATAMLQALIVTEVARATVGEKLTLGQLWKRAGNRMGAVIGYTLLLILAAAVGIGVFVGILVAVVAAVGAGSGLASSSPTSSSVMGSVLAVFGVVLLGYGGAAVLWLWLSTKLSFVPAAIVLERLPIRAAIARSWRLTQGYFWRTLGIQLLVSVMVGFAAQIVSFPISLIFTLAGSVLVPTGGSTADPLASTAPAVIALIATSVVASVVSAIGLVLQSATASLLYLDLRMRKEGLDLELSRFVEARQTGADVPDPYLPHSPVVAPPAS